MLERISDPFPDARREKARALLIHSLLGRHLKIFHQHSSSSHVRFKQLFRSCCNDDFIKISREYRKIQPADFQAKLRIFVP